MASSEGGGGISRGLCTSQEDVVMKITSKTVSLPSGSEDGNDEQQQQRLPLITKTAAADDDNNEADSIINAADATARPIIITNITSPATTTTTAATTITKTADANNNSMTTTTKKDDTTNNKTASSSGDNNNAIVRQPHSYLSHHVRAYSDISPIIPSPILEFNPVASHRTECSPSKKLIIDPENNATSRTHHRQNSDSLQLLMSTPIAAGDMFTIAMPPIAGETPRRPGSDETAMVPLSQQQQQLNGSNGFSSQKAGFFVINTKNINGINIAFNNSAAHIAGGRDLMQTRAFRPKTIQFQNLRYDVPINRRKDKKSILKSVSGEFKAGQLHAILGPSGAGKSTLMNVLAGYKIRNMTGTVLVNGKPRDLRAFRKMSCYIMQDDHLLPQLTVMESMMCSANLKLEETTSLKEKREVILEILETLGLRESSNNRVGNLSGGQRKRLSIALELINNPPLMFLDEPTSGLDSVSCYQCVQLLKRLALGGRNIICTIHQPSAKVFEIFDTVYMLADGQVIYDGPVDLIVPYFAVHNLNCPPYHNPSDFIMEVATGDYGDVVPGLTHNVRSGQMLVDISRLMKTTAKRSIGTQTAGALAASANGATGVHGAAGLTPSETADTEHPSSGSRAPSLLDSDSGSLFGVEQVSLAGGDGAAFPEKNNGKCHDLLSRREQPRNFATSVFTQFRILFIRTFITILRDSTLTQLRLGTHILIAVLIGLLYLQVGNDASKVVSNAACLFFCSLFLNFSAMMSTILTFPIEVLVFLREHLNYWYSLKAYYLAKTCADMPFQLALPLVYTIIVYFMTGQPNDFLRFFLFTTVLILTSLVSQSMGLLISAVTRAEIAVFVGPIIVIPLLLFSGFFATFDTMPKYLQWLSYASYMRYAFEGAMMSIYGFNRTGLTCDGIFASPDSPSGPPKGISPERVHACVLFSHGDAVLQSFSLQDVNYVNDVLALIVFFLFFRIACYFALRWRVNVSK